MLIPYCQLQTRLIRPRTPTWPACLWRRPCHCQSIHSPRQWSWVPKKHWCDVDDLSSLQFTSSGASILSSSARISVMTAHNIDAMKFGRHHRQALLLHAGLRVAQQRSNGRNNARCTVTMTHESQGRANAVQSGQPRMHKRVLQRLLSQLNYDNGTTPSIPARKRPPALSAELPPRDTQPLCQYIWWCWCECQDARPSVTSVKVGWVWLKTCLQPRKGRDHLAVDELGGQLRHQ